MPVEFQLMLGLKQWSVARGRKLISKVIAEVIKTVLMSLAIRKKLSVILGTVFQGTSTF